MVQINKKISKIIGLFGSSFNPPHFGHRAVIEDLTRNPKFDEIWLLPVFAHAFGKDLVPFGHRLTMLELMLKTLSSKNVRISKIEQELNKKPSYTYDVISALKQKYPDHEFYIVLGTDAQMQLAQWHRIDELKNMAKFYFIPRQGYAKSPYPQISSSEIRQRILNHEDIATFTSLEIIDYIKKHRIYPS